MKGTMENQETGRCPPRRRLRGGGTATVAPAPARRQREAAAPQLAMVSGRGPKGVRHATSHEALSNMSAVPLDAWRNL